MSKERLEELKGVLKSWEAWNDWNESQRIVLKDLTYYLERVQELEEESYNAHLERLLDRKEQQNKRYREALDKIGTLWKNATESTDDRQLTWLMYREVLKALEGEE